MSDLLKEAIADAKAVRETALQNAKMALEEAFTPQLKNMLAAKLKQEDETLEGEPVLEDEDAEDEEAEEGYHEDEVETEEIPIEDDEESDDDGDVNINIDADDDDEEGPEEMAHEDEAEEDDEVEIEEDNLDLEAIIKELESELSEEEDLGESEESSDETVEEAEESSEETVEESNDEAKEVDAVEEEYEIDVDTLKEEEDDDDEKEVDESTELSQVQSELKEYKEAVSFLKDKLHEVNILNAKLLFTNKLFKEYALDNNQKLKVVETFDRAQTTREIKLVYSTLAEQFGDNGSISRKVNSIKESASTKSGTTKPSKESKKVISEENNVANRFKKLAGIINS